MTTSTSTAADQSPHIPSRVPYSATLWIDEQVRARRAAGKDTLHLGFGEAGLPVPPEVADVLATAASHNSYGSVAGSDAARRATAGWFTRRGLPTEPEQVVLAPGSKPLLYALLSTLPGDVVLPRPSWVSYAAQAALAGRSVLWVDTPADAGGVPDPERLADALRSARAAGRDPRTLIITRPDNPTGTIASEVTLRQVCEVAERNGLVVISDEIYRDLAYDLDDAETDGVAGSGDAMTSAASLLPDKVVVTGGLSKSMALGGWRIGFLRLPASAWGERTRAELLGVASEVWSCLAAPMQHVAAYVLDDPALVRAHIARSRRLHAMVARAAHTVVIGAGARCRPPAGGFYLYPDLAPFRRRLAARGITDGRGLADALLDAHGVAVLPGVAFGDSPTALRFRMATSLLYGQTDAMRWLALGGDEPTRLPWIADGLTWLGDALAALLV